ncbi:hypothetical protein [Halopseudomonas pelagia]|uniref:Uncharacterized protein n=1 Tax=Halopseudomonas pelagia TaxID=553151 RepID=A0AA91TYJ9_9GAMM|nr:hypothetical protein [Halopseudomonas pelagia]PCC97319.1 hypothetical protein CO192_21350 [Halopseudomonas pelagia]QFY58523.1 hypothetical protein EAO82_20490 [Halopseudomonas pelagia]
MSLSRKQVLELAKILHSTTKSLGQSSKLSTHQEKLSHLLGYRHWNAASAGLPETIPEETAAAIALLEVPGQTPMTFLEHGRAAPWKMPLVVRDYLIAQSLDPDGFGVTSYTRPTPVLAQKPRFLTIGFSRAVGEYTEHRELLDPNDISYCHQNHTPIMVTFADHTGRFSFKLTLWLVTFSALSDSPIYFNGASHKPMYNSIVETITGIEPFNRKGYCLVNSDDARNPHALIKCDEQGREIEHIRNLPLLSESELWTELKAYNELLNLSLTDAAEITQSTVYKYSEYAGGETFD